MPRRGSLRRETEHQGNQTDLVHDAFMVPYWQSLCQLYKPFSPSCVPLYSLSCCLLVKVLLLWWGLSRERGKNLRRRERCFRAWSQWAPRNRRLKAAKRITIAWTHKSCRATFFRLWASAMHVCERGESFLPLWMLTRELAAGNCG